MEKVLFVQRSENGCLMTTDLQTCDAVNADDKHDQKIHCPPGVCQDANALCEVQHCVPSGQDNQSSRRLIIQEGAALSKLRCMQFTRNDPTYTQRRSWVEKD